jgi:hypothetical protein
LRLPLLFSEQLREPKRAAWPKLCGTASPQCFSWCCSSAEGLEYWLSRFCPLSYAIALVCSIGYGFQLPPDAELALLTLASLLIFKHLIYEYVFLILLLALVLKRSSRAGKGLTV